jgi:hypothetical protein
MAAKSKSQNQEPDIAVERVAWFAKLAYADEIKDRDGIDLAKAKLKQLGVQIKIEPKRGIVPASWPLVTVGVDLGKYLAH